MSNFVHKFKENQSQKLPSAATTSSLPRRSVLTTSTSAITINKNTITASTTSKGIPQLRRSVPAITVNKTPDLLHPPKFSDQQLTNRKPDITKNLPYKITSKPSPQPKVEKQQPETIKY